MHDLYLSSGRSVVGLQVVSFKISTLDFALISTRSSTQITNSLKAPAVFSNFFLLKIRGVISLLESHHDTTALRAVSNLDALQ